MAGGRPVVYWRWWLCAAAVLGGAWSATQPTIGVERTLGADPTETLPGEAAHMPVRPRRLREGTRLENVVGKFEVTGDRITFYPASQMEPLRLLENLALERVVHQLSGIRPGRTWRVNGLVTEYRGGNYLLLSRAVLQSATAP